MLDETKIDGGDMMQTLAQELKKEGKKEGDTDLHEWSLIYL